MQIISQYASQPSNYNYQQPSGNYGASPYSSKSASSSPLSRFELVVIVLSILGLAGTFTWGFMTRQRLARDVQRREHIYKIVEALDSYYLNSSQTKADRRYPPSSCGTRLNSYDYEFTLRRYLTGQVVTADTHNYIGGEYPLDPWGEYSKTLGEREIDFLCVNILDPDSTTIYPGGWESCNFSSQEQTKYKKCYTYASDNKAERFTLSYYAEELGRFITISRYRDDPIVDEYEQITNPPVVTPAPAEPDGAPAN